MSQLSDKNKALLLSLKPEDISKDFVDKHFSVHYDTKTKKTIAPEISFQDKFTLKANEYINTTDVETNAGQLLINKILFERTPRIQKVLGYIAIPITKGVLGDIENKLSKSAMDEVIKPEDMAKYFDAVQWLGNTLHTNCASSFTPMTTKPLPDVIKERDRLYKENADELANGNVVKAVEISDKLLNMAKKELKGDIGMAIYDSGAKASFDNNYKSTFITRGPVFNPVKERFDILENAFMEGMKKKDIASYGTQVINGAYPKAIGTSDAGYVTKKYFASYQSIVLDKPGSDCGSKAYREVMITNKNKSKLMYRYILVGTKLVLLTSSEIEKYVGKVVKMRSPMYCLNDKICSKCAGESFYKIGIQNIGLATSSIGAGYLNMLMKSFHDTTVKVSDIDLNDIII